MLSESEFVTADIDEDVVLAMCRGEEALAKLQRLEDKGLTVVNSGYGIENCVRMIMMRLLEDAGVPIPESYVVDTDVEARRRLLKAGFGACWIKKVTLPCFISKISAVAGIRKRRRRSCMSFLPRHSQSGGVERHPGRKNPVLRHCFFRMVSLLHAV